MPEYLSFRGGFFLANRNEAYPDLAQDWPETPVGTYRLTYHPAWEYWFSQSGANRVHCLGVICDVFATDKAPAVVVSDLSSALAVDWKTFFQVLRYTGGTYVLFIEKGDRTYVILDAVGTVATCFSNKGGRMIVASHPRLIAETEGQSVSAWAKDWLENPVLNKGGRYFPGITTPYDGISYVMPNQRLDVANGQMARFYPDRDIVERSCEEIVDLVAPALEGQLQQLVDRYPLAFALSGGVDSRLTLAASRPISSSATYFTYYSENNKILNTDLKVARQLRKRFELRHIEMKMGDPLPPKTFGDQFRLESDGLHGGVGTNYLLHHYLDENYLHIRSNVLETVRGFYLKNRLNRENKFDATKLSRLFREDMAPEFEHFFQAFIDECSFHPSALFNYHYTDMFYWEHRLGAWLGPGIRGTRMVMDTYIIYNSRALLELMMARPPEERVQATVIRRLIERLWPELLEVPIFSGSKFLDFRAKKGFR